MFQLETERLLLREWSSDDWRLLQPIAADPEVMRYIGAGVPWTESQTEAFVRRQVDSQRRYGFCLWQAVGRSEGRLLGHCGLQPFGDSGEIEAGWWLTREAWGRGLATEAARAVLGYAFVTALLPRVIAVAYPENAASVRVMQKIGMTFERRCRRNELGMGEPDAEVVVYVARRQM